MRTIKGNMGANTLLQCPYCNTCLREQIMICNCCGKKFRVRVGYVIEKADELNIEEVCDGGSIKGNIGNEGNELQ